MHRIVTTLLLLTIPVCTAAANRRSSLPRKLNEDEGKSVLHNDQHVKEAAGEVIAQLFHKHDHYNKPDKEHHHKEDSYYYENPSETYKADHHGASHHTGYNPKPEYSGYLGTTPYPTKSATKSPTGSPTSFATKWPTSPPTTSSRTNSPTKPSSSPTKWPTSSPTNHSPTYSPTKPQPCKKHGDKCKCGVDICCPGLKTTCDNLEYVEWGLCLEAWEE